MVTKGSSCYVTRTSHVRLDRMATQRDFRHVAPHSAPVPSNDAAKLPLARMICGGGRMACVERDDHDLCVAAATSGRARCWHHTVVLHALFVCFSDVWNRTRAAAIRRSTGGVVTACIRCIGHREGRQQSSWCRGCRYAASDRAYACAYGYGRRAQQHVHLPHRRFWKKPLHGLSEPRSTPVPREHRHDEKYNYDLGSPDASRMQALKQ